MKIQPYLHQLLNHFNITLFDVDSIVSQNYNLINIFIQELYTDTIYILHIKTGEYQCFCKFKDTLYN